MRWRVVVSLMTIIGCVAEGGSTISDYRETEETNFPDRSNDDTAENADSWVDFAVDDSGGGTIQSRLYKSGTRIRARVGSTTDGAQMWMGWHDTDLDIDCAFRNTSDGRMRCVPTVTGWVPIFLDAGCTQRLVAIWNCSLPLKWVEVCPPTATTCNAAGCDWYEVAGEYQGATYWITGGECVEVKKEYFPSTYVALSLGNKVDPNIFAELTTRVE